METKDLKLGDWVYYTKPITGEKAITGEKEACRIANIGEDMVRCQDKPLSHLNGISPIPLTKGILDKNRGRWMNTIYLYTKDKTNAELINWIVCIGNYQLSLDIRIIHYVHELQHIIWALGMDDNLKL